jgi:hypothetical protein
MGTKYNGALPPKYDNMTMWIDVDNPKSFNPGGLYGDDYPAAGSAQTATYQELYDYANKYTHNFKNTPPGSHQVIAGLNDISPGGHNYTTYEGYNAAQRVVGPVHGKWYFSVQNSNYTLNGYADTSQNTWPYLSNLWLDTSWISHEQSSAANSHNDQKFWDSSYEGMDSNGLVNGHAITNYYCVIGCLKPSSVNNTDNKIWQILINNNVIRSYNSNLADGTDIVPLAPGMIVDCGTTFGHWEIGPAITTTARSHSGAIYSFHPIRPAVYNTQFPHPKWAVDQFILAQVPIKPTGDGIVFHKTLEETPNAVYINTTSSAEDKFWWGKTTTNTNHSGWQLKFHPDATDVPTFDSTKYYYFYIYDEFGSLRVVTRKNPTAAGGDWDTIKFHARPHGALIEDRQYAIVVHEGLETASSNHWPPVMYPNISLGSRGVFSLAKSFMRVGSDSSDDKIQFGSYTGVTDNIVANYFTLNCWVRMTFETEAAYTQWEDGQYALDINDNQNVDQQFDALVERTIIACAKVNHSTASPSTFTLGIGGNGAVEFVVHDENGSPTVPQGELKQILSNGTEIDGLYNNLPGATITTNEEMVFKGTSHIGNRNRNWHMISVTWHAYDDEVKIYVDGELETYIKWKGSVGFGFRGLGQPRSDFYGTVLRLGEISRNQQYNNSQDSSMIDVNQFQMWANQYTDVVLSDDEIKQLYESSRQRFNK